MSWNIAKPGDQINGPVAVTGNLNVDSNTLFVDSANNRVGVLTASPTVPLDVVGDAKVSGNLTVDTNTLVVDAANNRLGIGTATPSSNLHIRGTGTSTFLTVGDAGANYNIMLGTQTADIAQLAAFNTTIGSGSKEFWLTASAHVFNTWSGSAYSNRMVIASDGVCTWSNVGGVAGTAMTLNGTGLGIGASPSTNLHVYGAAPRAMIENSANNGIYLRLKRPNKEYIVALDINNNGGNDFTIWDNTAAASRLTIDNVGNCGIGTATPAYKLDVINANVSGTSWSGIRYRDTSVNCEGYVGVYNSVVQVGATSNHPLDLYAGGSNRVRIDTAGNLGLGVTPSAGYSGVSALEIGSLGSTLMSGGTFGGTVYLGQNSYYNGTWRFARASAACLFGQNNDKSFAWYQSSNATPTVGGAINWTQAMTLDPSGNLGLANVIPSSWLYNGFSVGSGTGNFGVTIYSGTANNGILAFADGSSSTARYSGYIQYAHGNDSMEFATQSTGRLSIKSTGQVNFVGLASDPAGAAAGDVYYNTTTNKLKCYNGTTWNDLF